MPQYAVLQSHPPGDCPIASKGARQWFLKIFPQLGKVAKKHGVKFVVPYLHLDPAHKAILLLEAANAEAVRDFLVEGGFLHFADMEFYLVSPMDELAKGIHKVPTIYP